MRRLSTIASTLIERANPPPESDDEEEELQYDIYGWFNYETDAPGVKRLDRQWVALELAASAEGWEDAVKAYEQKLQTTRTIYS